MTKQFLAIIIALGSIIHTNVSAQTKENEQDTIATFKQYADEKPASFPGGVDGWRKYLQENLHYPKKALRKNIQGLVKVQMVVDSKGNVTQVKAQNDPGGGLAEEAERVIKEGPNWIPAFQNGKNVTYRFTQSITFQLQ